jgi:hypothetical protein
MAQIIGGRSKWNYAINSSSLPDNEQDQETLFKAEHVNLLQCIIWEIYYWTLQEHSRSLTDAGRGWESLEVAKPCEKGV